MRKGGDRCILRKSGALGNCAIAGGGCESKRNFFLTLAMLELKEQRTPRAGPPGEDPREKEAWALLGKEKEVMGPHRVWSFSDEVGGGR